MITEDETDDYGEGKEEKTYGVQILEGKERRDFHVVGFIMRCSLGGVNVSHCEIVSRNVKRCVSVKRMRNYVCILSICEKLVVVGCRLIVVSAGCGWSSGTTL